MPPAAPPPAACPPVLRLHPQGWAVPCAPETTLREAAAAVGITLPTSCRNGTCRHCIAQLLSGTVRYRVEWPGLSREERAEGWTLPCVALPVGDVVLSAPRAHRAEPAEPPSPDRQLPP